MSLDKQYIERLSTTYSKTANQAERDFILRELFSVYQPFFQQRSLRASKETGIDPFDFESAISEKLWTALESWTDDGGASFYTYLRKTQELAIKDVIRKYSAKKRDRYSEVYTEDIVKKDKDDLSDNYEVSNKESDVGSLELSCNQDNELLDGGLIKNDQRQLVEELLVNSGKSEPKIRVICELYLNNDCTSLQEAANQLGEKNKKTVSNRLKKLKPIFGEIDCGSLEDYNIFVA